MNHSKQETSEKFIQVKGPCKALISLAACCSLDREWDSIGIIRYLQCLMQHAARFAASRFMLRDKC